MIKLKYTLADAVKPIMILLVIAMAFVAFVAGAIGYKVGYRQGTHKAAVLALGEDGKTLTTNDIKAIRLESEIIKAELATLTQERDISLNNLNLLKEELQAVKESKASLEKLNDTLRRATLQEGGMPLKVLSADMKSLSDDTYEYRFEVAMLSADGKGKTLTPKLTLLNATSMVNIPIKPATYELNGIVVVDGRYVMPDNFKPSQMKLKLTVDGKHLEQLYDWKVSR